MKLVFTFVGVFLMCSSSLAFDVDGFKSGMSMQEIREKLLTWNFDQVDEKPNHILASDEERHGRTYSFSFRNNKLYILQKLLKPSARNFIIAAGLFREQLGKPIDIKVDRAITSSGENNVMRIIWSQTGETTGLNYSVFPQNDQLDVVYEVSSP